MGEADVSSGEADLPARPRPPRTLPESARAWVEWFGAARLLLTALSICVVIGGGFLLLRAAPPTTEAALPTVSPSAGSPASTLPPPPVATDGPTTVIVHVAGAVAAPGVYELPSSARVVSAVEAAGGALVDARLDAVNLAAPLADGQRVYLPVEGEEFVDLVAPDSTGAGAGGATAGPIDVNRASTAELESLPGIGPATAAAIVDHREREGPFASVDDLQEVRGIGPAKLGAIRELVTV